MRHFLALVAFWLLEVSAGLALAQSPPGFFPGGPGTPLPALGAMFPTQLPPPYPPPLLPLPVRHDPMFGPICPGPLGEGPCADVHRFLLVHHAANYIQIPLLSFHPATGPICNGPLGPSPCRAIQIFIAVQMVAQQQIQPPTWQSSSMCIGPLGPGPCDAVRTYLMQTQSGIAGAPQQFDLRNPQSLNEVGPNGEPMCMGPTGPIPCALLAQAGLDMNNGGPPALLQPVVIADAQKRAHACAQSAGLDIAAFTACTGRTVVLPQRQHAVIDCAVSNSTAAGFAACAADKFGIGLSPEQKTLAKCAMRSKGAEDAFLSCAGTQFTTKLLAENERAILNCAAAETDPVKFGQCAADRFVGRAEKAVLDCAINTSDAEDFAACAAPNVGVKMSNEQRVLAKCAVQAGGDTNAFASCAGADFLANGLGQNEKNVLNCATSSSGDMAKFATCSTNSIFGNRMSKEQQIAVQCAAQSQGDPTGFATCAGANLFGMQLNAEQQIAVQCVVGTGGNPPVAAGCMASRLTMREFTKCMTDGIGGKGCFGDNNDLVGKNGFVGRTIGQIAGGPNSVINNPDQIWGGDNSFVRNPSQVWGGPNSFVRNPVQIWGGPNSVFNNPSQLLPAPRPIQIGKVGGKRICLPWC